MRNKILNFGVIGLGSISAHHIKSIQALPDCRLMAVSSRNAEKRMKAESEWQVKVFADEQEMLRLPELDVVCICTPSGHHLEPCLEAARQRKHVITEKPLEINLARAKQMIEACRQAEVTLSCIFQNRFSPDFQVVKEAVQRGALGRLVLGNAYIKWYRPAEYYQSSSWRGTLAGDGGAALINQGIHTIDLLVHLMGSVRSVFGKIKTLTHQIEGEDLGTAMLEFESGALGTIEGSTTIFDSSPERLEIHGDQGSLILEGGHLLSNATTERLGLKSAERKESSGSSNPMAIDVSLHVAQFNEIVESIRSGKASSVSGTEALKSLEVVEAIYQSSKEGREIRLRGG